MSTFRGNKELLGEEIESKPRTDEMLRKEADLLGREEKALDKAEHAQLGLDEELPTVVAAKGEGNGVKGDENALEVTGGKKKKKLPTTRKTVSFFEMFKYADKYDYVLLLLGVIGAIGDGLCLPIALFITSGLIDAFGKNGPTTMPPGDFESLINKYVVRFVYLALGGFVACFLEASCLMQTGDRQASKIRYKYLRAILRHDQGFFDTAGADTAEVVSSVTTDTLTIQDAISEKMGIFVANLTTFIGGYVVGFYMVWKIALILVAFSPLLVVPGILYGRTLTTLARKMQATYLQAGSIAEQAISSIRTVYSFVGEERTKARYSKSLDRTVEIGKKMGLAKGLAIGLNGVNFGLWGFMSWYGSRLVINDGESGGRVITGGLAMLTGGLALGTALPNIKYFSEGQSAATRIFEMIERIPEIDSDSTSGKVLTKLEGRMELRNVDFAYPSRMDQQIFNNFNLTIPPGLTVALVGGSGSGKSTVIALLERFYDPLAGEILIDGINIRDFQLKWLRTQIGLVSQEPALFATSIKENISFGKDGASMEEIIAAAKAANAHTFITGFTEGYETQVGERGVQMSGGQKQRIAIARALLKNPPILLLDEATSALDTESEKIVQEALDSASVGRTTVVVAHRLSTIQNADLIAVVSGGQVVEQGTHESLLEIEGGYYATLVTLQQAKRKSSDGEESDEKARSSSLRTGGDKSGRRSSSLTLTASQRLNLQLRNGGSGRYSSSSLRVSGVGGPLDIIDDEKQAKPPSFRRLLKMNKPEWKEGLLGTLGAIGFGIVHPSYAFILGSMISTLYLTDFDKMRREVTIYASIFGGLAVLCFLVNFLQHYFFAAMGELLTKRVRERMLAQVLTFEVGWFDQEENSSGAICGRLASEANVARSLVGDRISLVIQTTAAILVGSIVGLVISWKLTIVMIAVQPLVILCYYSKKVLLTRMYSLTMQSQEAASQVASEAVIHHRTITAYSAQDKVMRLFEDMQVKPRRESKRRSYIAGVGLGTALCATYCTWALDFWWGGLLVKRQEVSFGDMFKCFFILVASGRMIAEAGSMTSDLAKGASSIITVFNILDRKTKIDPEDDSGLKLEKIDGNVELKGVDFAYPSRPDILVMRGFNLRVRAGKNVALVGKSGSGKSTIIGLIERFYDPLKGKVLIDDYNIKDIHLRTLRSHIALVGQEPTLFTGTIRDNILYGRDNATEAEIIEAAKAANAYTFISALKDGFDTNTGERGLQLSGGQKQRIAIARAILKNPAILLLDEATSALDAQSEKIVQDALDRIMVGRTTIVVAHRLSTIQNCDTIAVIQSGAILEKGTHHELLAKGEGGAYYSLVKLQRKEPQN
ncbi:hypothetical protein R1sor_003434 [Riccia sorocarpa]|uniref:Uncharacterized protein n=1 Tax=Riccia sorocarpa TaxID=122646 RepID=A0ABD3H1L2_9MARC